MKKPLLLIFLILILIIPVASATSPYPRLYTGGYDSGGVIYLWQQHPENFTFIANGTWTNANIYDICQAGDYVYACGENGLVKQYYASNMTLRYNATYSTGEARGIWADDTYCYVAGYTIKKVYQYYASNMTYSGLSSSVSGNYPAARMTGDADYIYWGTDTGNVYQLYQSNLSARYSASPGGEIRAVWDDDDYAYFGSNNNNFYVYYKTNFTLKGTVAFGGDVIDIETNESCIFAVGQNATTAANSQVKSYWKSDLSATGINSPYYGGQIQAITIGGDYVYCGGDNASGNEYTWRLNIADLSMDNTCPQAYAAQIFALYYEEGTCPCLDALVLNSMENATTSLYWNLTAHHNCSAVAIGIYYKENSSSTWIQDQATNNAVSGTTYSDYVTGLTSDTLYDYMTYYYDYCECSCENINGSVQQIYTEAIPPSWKGAGHWNISLSNTSAWIISDTWSISLYNISAWHGEDPVYEHFNETANMDGYGWLGYMPQGQMHSQGFTVGYNGPNENFVFTGVELFLKANETLNPSPTLYVNLKTSSSYKPSTNLLPISNGSITLNGISSTGAWYYIPMEERTLTAGTMYHINCSVSRGDTVFWRACSNSTVPGSATYMHGTLCVSSTNGSSWSVIEYIDQLFKVHGYPVGGSASDWVWNAELQNNTIFMEVDSWNIELDGIADWRNDSNVWNVAVYNWTLYSLNVTVEGNGFVTWIPDKEWYNGTETVTFTAHPYVLCAFDHWGNDLSGNTNPETLLIDADKEVLANFSGSPYTYADNDTDAPGIGDVIDPGGGIFNWARIFTVSWIWAFGGWFIAIILGIIGGALWLQYHRVEVPGAYFLLVLIIYAVATTDLAYVITVGIAMVIGYLLFRVIGKRKDVSD